MPDLQIFKGRFTWRTARKVEDRLKLRLRDLDRGADEEL